MSDESDGRRKARRWEILGLVAGLALVWILWSQWDHVRSLFGPEAPPAPSAEAPTNAAAGEEEPSAASPSEAERRWEELLGAPPVWPRDLAAPADCAEIEEQMAHLCHVLDERQALGTTRVPGGTCGLIREVVEQLAAHPPELDSELESYGTILANVFHVFRVLGEQRLDLLRQVTKANASFDEPAAMALYRWLASREQCARSGQTPITLDSLYAYSGFLFETLGGQAYLRRRPPRQEALASLYALLILDRSVEQKKNPQGLDPRSEIVRTRALIEAQPFVFRSGYVNLLDEMEERWKRRGIPAGE